jgi:acyl CoA:acetate/3-ketoacid CoA transferase beta subunit
MNKQIQLFCRNNIPMKVSDKHCVKRLLVHVIEPTVEGLLLREIAPGLSIERVVVATEAKLIIPAHVPERALSPTAC